MTHSFVEPAAGRYFRARAFVLFACFAVMLACAFAAVGGEEGTAAEQPRETYSDNATSATDNTSGKQQMQQTENANYGQDGNGPGASCPPSPPTVAEVEDYRRRLEMRLLERYNNLPEYAGRVGRVTVVLSKPLQTSLDGSMIRAEFDQVVLDPWGKRIPALEKEYYRVTFGSGGARLVRSDPSIRIGLDMEKTYSEQTPLSADPFARAPEARAFRPEPVPAVRMPEWWRPDFPEIR